MKKTLILLTLLLGACAAPTEDQTVVGPQALQTIQLGGSQTAPTATEPATEEPALTLPATTEPAAPVTPTAATDAIPNFANQQEFVQFMADELNSLEGSLIMLDANLNEALNSEDPTSILALRDFMIAGVRQDQANLEAIPPYNEAVVNLQHYLSQAFHFSMEQKAAEFEIFSAESLETRSQLLAANSDNEQKSANYLALARQEINNLSDTPLQYRKS